MRCKKWYERSTRTFKICCATPLHQVFVVVQPRPALQLPAGTPHELLLWLLLGKKFQCTAVQVYCDVDRVCSCSNTRGWARVANLDMRNPSQQCPGELTSSETRRLCGRGSLGAGCVSAVYSTYSISYSHVCGRVIGYEFLSPDAFRLVASQTIEDAYVDGVSLTHGSPGARQHIWTFAGGILESYSPPFHPTLFCPCVNGTFPPSFVGNDYFCESGNLGTTFTDVLYASDPLWDGQGCGSITCFMCSPTPDFTMSGIFIIEICILKSVLPIVRGSYMGPNIE